MDSLDRIPETHPIVAHLSKRGAIANFDERETLLAQRRIESVIAPDGDVQVTICPTLACNFECPYCFATRGKGKMGEDVQDEVVALVGRMLDAGNAKKLTITWFGGEPLLATDVMPA